MHSAFSRGLERPSAVSRCSGGGSAENFRLEMWHLHDWHSHSTCSYRRISCGWIYGYDGCVPFLPAREKKLEILKDSHIGAFSVICLVLYELIYIGAYSEIDAVRQAGIVAAGFFLSRCLSGIAAMTFPGAKKEGLLYMFTSKAHERAVKTALFLQTAAVAVLMLYLDGVTGVAVLVGAGLTFLYYYKKCKKELGRYYRGYRRIFCDSV